MKRILKNSFSKNSENYITIKDKMMTTLTQKTEKGSLIPLAIITPVCVFMAMQTIEQAIIMLS